MTDKSEEPNKKKTPKWKTFLSLIVLFELPHLLYYFGGGSYKIGSGLGLLTAVTFLMFIALFTTLICDYGDDFPKILTAMKVLNSVLFLATPYAVSYAIGFSFERGCGSVVLILISFVQLLIVIFHKELCEESEDKGIYEL